MDTQTAIELFRQALLTSLWISGPLLLVGLIAGVAMSLLQILTSIQDSSFSAVPRLAAFVAATILALPWMTARLLNYTTVLFSDFHRFAR